MTSLIITLRLSLFLAYTYKFAFNSKIYIILEELKSTTTNYQTTQIFELQYKIWKLFRFIRVSIYGYVVHVGGNWTKREGDFWVLKSFEFLILSCWIILMCILWELARGELMAVGICDMLKGIGDSWQVTGDTWHIRFFCWKFLGYLLSVLLSQPVKIFILSTSRISTLGFNSTNGDGFKPSPFSSGVPRDTIGKRNPSLLDRYDERMKMCGKALGVSWSMESLGQKPSGPAAPRVLALGLP